MASMKRRRRLLWTAGVLLVVLVSTGQYLRAKYDVTRFLRSTALNWVSMHTTWLVASPEEIDEQIAAARHAWPFAESAPRPATGPLRVLRSNPRYFTDGSGRAIYLAGSHTWSNFQDNGGSDPPPVFDYEKYLDFLEAHHHNFFRLWVWENSRWSLSTPDDDYWYYPMGPFLRTGPGKALDGKPKWDVTRFDQSYFDRLRRRVVEAGDRGIYVSVMLFDGWSVASHKGGAHARNPWHAHPLNEANNVNGVDGDPNGDDSGLETEELGNDRVLAIEEAYVRKVIDTVGDLDNVLYEIVNEGDSASVPWQYHMIDFIKAYEAKRPKQHPVGMTATWPNGSNEVLFASDADWISPTDYADPPPSDGSKVIISDTDHIWGVGGDRSWVWKSFTRGMNVAFMDGYDGEAYGSGGLAFDLDKPKWVSLRRNMGYVRAYADRMDLAAMIPRSDLCSTGYCLVRESGDSVEVLTYAPDGGSVEIDLSAGKGELAVEWFDPGTARVVQGTSVEAGGKRSLSAPFEGDAVLYLHTE